MRPARTPKVRAARLASRQALGHDIDAEACDGGGAAKPHRIETPLPVLYPVSADAEAVVSITEAARLLAVGRSEVEAMVRRGEIRTVPVGLRATPWVPVKELLRAKAERTSPEG